MNIQRYQDSRGYHLHGASKVMRRLVLILLLSLTCFAQEINVRHHPAPAPSGCTGYLVCQNFEGTGYDNGETWTSESPTVLDPDYATAPLLGSQSLRVSESGGTAKGAYKDFTVGAHKYGFFILKMTAIGSGSNTFLMLGNGSGPWAYIYRNAADGALKVYVGGTLTGTVTIDPGTAYNAWWEYSNNSRFRMWVSTNTTKGTAVVDNPIGDNGSISRMWLSANDGGDNLFDHVHVSDSDITGVP